MAVKEVCDAGYITMQCRCMSETHGGVTVVPCKHEGHVGLLMATDAVLRLAGLVPLSEAAIKTTPPVIDMMLAEFTRTLDLAGITELHLTKTEKGWDATGRVTPLPQELTVTIARSI